MTRTYEANGHTGFGGAGCRKNASGNVYWLYQCKGPSSLIMGNRRQWDR